MSNSGKKVHVTGGGSGIGLAIARMCGEHGYDVTISGRDPAKLAAAGLPHIVMDVTDGESIRNGLDEIGPPDIFIANAGAASTAPALKTSRAVWDDMLAVNLTSVYLCAQAAIPSMVEQKWGRFISIASTASLKGYAYTGAYAAAKHGVLGWIRSLAIELAKTGVTANAICPGFTDTPLVDNALDNVTSKSDIKRDDALASFVKGNPMNRLVAPEEVASAALWLASEEASAVNGQTIVVDGGEVIS